MLVGSTAVTTGAGLLSVIVPVAVAVVSTTLVAFTWMVFGVRESCRGLVDSVRINCADGRIAASVCR